MPLQKHAEEASSRLRAAAEALQGCTSLTAVLLGRGHQVDVSYRLPALGRLHCCLSMCDGASTALTKSFLPDAASDEERFLSVFVAGSVAGNVEKEASAVLASSLLMTFG
ncbi:hypothetical protein ABPG77_006311 [Micractinium sp. CCAP 211/92]